MSIEVFITESYGADVSMEIKKNGKRTVIELTAQEVDTLQRKLLIALSELDYEDTMSTVRKG